MPGRRRSRGRRVSSACVRRRWTKGLCGGDPSRVGNGSRFDYYVWLLTDPASAVGCAPLADVPCLPDCRVDQAQVPDHDQPVDDIDRRAGAVGRLSDFTVPEVMPSSWGEILQTSWSRRHRLDGFADRYGCWGFLDLWRCRRRVFDRSDAGCWPLLATPSRVRASDRQAGRSGLRNPSLRPIAGPAVLIFNDHLASPPDTAATQWLRTMLPTAPCGAPIPAAALNVAAQLLAAEAGVDNHPAAARAFVPGRRLGDPARQPNGIRGGIRRTGGPLRCPSRRPGRRPRSTCLRDVMVCPARERELLELLAEKADTTEIAENMNDQRIHRAGPPQVDLRQDRLSSRSALLTTALGPGSGG